MSSRSDEPVGEVPQLFAVSTSPKGVRTFHPDTPDNPYRPEETSVDVKVSAKHALER